MHICTIIAKNYVASARVLARSLAETNPDAKLWTLVIDDFSRHIDPSQEPFEILTPAQVGCEPFAHMALRYSVLELSTAVKPWLLRYLMGVTDGPVTYMDPDIKVYGSLEPLDVLATEHGVVLIPHSSEPIPQDGRKPSQVDIMIAGIYNLGYVSLTPRPEVDRLLDWWAERLRRDCRVDPIWGYFVDQRWFDLAPGFLTDLAILREPQYNLAYWNLHERRLERDGERFLVNGQPLAFFHFSGFDPEEPLILSRHQNRIDVTENPVLEELLQGYAADVLAQGYAEARHWPYDYGSLGDGTRLDDSLRNAFDEYATAHDDDVPSPFTLEGVQAFDAWLAAPAPHAPPGITRAAARVYETRTDIRGAFPDVAGADREAFLEWTAGRGTSEESLLARIEGASAAPRGDEPDVGGADGAGASAGSVPLRGAPWGVNVVGDFRSEGVGGEVSRALVSALDSAGERVLPVLSRVATPDPHDRSYDAVSAPQAPYTVNLLCIDPDVLPELVHQVGRDFFAGRYSIGLWFWPLEKFPSDWRTRFSLLEEVWVPSEFAAQALGPQVPIPIRVMPFPISAADVQARTRPELGLPDGRLFLTRVDYRTDPELQNPLAAVEAFRRAFAHGEEARLVIDCVQSGQAPAAHDALRSAAAEDPRIQLVERQRTEEEWLSAIGLCDCYVSLHRAQAFGLDCARAMALGRPVIATGYSGNLEFMTAGNSFLVDYQRSPVGGGHDPYPADAEWADPKLEHAARLMHDVHHDPDAARERAAIGAADVRERCSPGATADFVARRLGAIRATGQARRAADPLAEMPRTLARLPKRIREGPPPGPAGRGGAVRSQLRSTILRVMKPYTAHQQKIDNELVGALGELANAIGQVRDGTSDERAQRLAAARRLEAFAPEALRLGIEEIKRVLTEQTDRSSFLALSELNSRHLKVSAAAGAAPEDRGLTGFELRVFSQNGEDGILTEILRRVGAPTRYFVEFGVESGREGNCVFLADAAGWTGLFMEADDEMFGRLEGKYAAQRSVSTIRARVGTENVESLFAQAGVPAEPDVVSIDVDGQDYWIWAALEAYRPRVLIVEYNSALDPRRRLVQPDEPGHGWDGTSYYGASLGALESLAETKGYRLVHTDLSAVNAFFVRTDLSPEAFPEPDRVARRGTPNYYQRGIEHPAAPVGVRYLDLDTGRLVRGRPR